MVTDFREELIITRESHDENEFSYYWEKRDLTFDKVIAYDWELGLPLSKVEDRLIDFYVSLNEIDRAIKELLQQGNLHLITEY